MYMCELVHNIHTPLVCLGMVSIELLSFPVLLLAVFLDEATAIGCNAFLSLLNQWKNGLN